MTRAAFLALAKKVGVTLEVNDGTYEVLTPSGKRFAATGIHMLRIDNNPRGRWSTAAIYQDLAGDVAPGLATCDVEDCDYCDGGA